MTIPYKLTIILILMTITTISCVQIIPNIQNIILGYNAQVGQLDDPSSIKNPIFDTLTFTRHKIISLNQTTFLVPDQLFVMDYSTLEQTSTNEVYTSQLVLQESMSESYAAGYNPWFSPCMFSDSSNAHYFHEINQIDAEYMATSYLRVTNYKASLTPEIKLNPYFENQLNDLPDNYNETTCPHYKKFFDMFGTHYFYSVIFGGTVEMTTSFSIEILQDTTIAEIQKDLNTQFFLMTTSETLSEQQEEQLTQLNAVYKSSFKLIGGDPSAYNATEYQKWAQTVLSDPLIVNMEIYNFTTLLQKNYTQNKQKINALNMAIKEYFYSPYSTWQTIGIVPPSLIHNVVPPPYKYYVKGIFSTLVNSLVYVVIDNVIYFPISYDYSLGYYYNTKSNLWFDMTPIYQLNIINYSPVCSGVNNTIYCFVDDGSNSYAHTYSYNTKTNDWIELANADWSFKGATATTVGSDIYILGSDSQAKAFTDNCTGGYLYPNPIVIYNSQNNTFSYLYSRPGECLMYYQSVVIGEDIYTFGGRSCYLYESVCKNFDYIMLNSTYKFSPYHNSWTKLADIPELLYEPGIAVFDGKIYLTGGSVIDKYVQAYPNFDPVFKPNYFIYSYDVVGNFWAVVDSDSYETAKMGILISEAGFLFYLSDNIQVIAPNNFC